MERMERELGVFSNESGEYKLVSNGTFIELLWWNPDHKDWAVVDYFSGNNLCAKLAEELVCQTYVSAEEESSAITSKKSGSTGAPIVERR